MFKDERKFLPNPLCLLNVCLRITKVEREKSGKFLVRQLGRKGEGLAYIFSIHVNHCAVRQVFISNLFSFSSIVASVFLFCNCFSERGGDNPIQNSITFVIVYGISELI